ncbi:MAG: hypothetical protein AAF703_22855 [Cyanobacteria bacterium P01_D01_bin.105]
MRLEDISPTLQNILDAEVQPIAPGMWAGTTPNFHLLVRLSENQTELQILLPLIPASDTSAHQEVIAAYADLFQQADHTVLRDMLWAVFPYPLASTDAEALAIALPSLFERHEHFLIDYFQSVADKQMRRLIQSSKQSGRSLKATLQFLEYAYRENLLGELLEDDEQGREAVLAQWRAKIVQYWEAVDE